MRAQLDRLVEAAELSHVTLQALPTPSADISTWPDRS
jgi:hypothetical protein